jgi:hypothetical protein
MSKSREAFLWMVGLSLVTLVLGLLREFAIARELQASGAADLFFRGLVVINTARMFGMALFRARWIPVPAAVPAGQLMRAERWTCAVISLACLMMLALFMGAEIAGPTGWALAGAVVLAVYGSAVRALAERAGRERSAFALEWALPIGAIAGALLVPRSTLGPALGLLAGLGVGLVALLPILAKRTGPEGQVSDAPRAEDPARTRVLLLDALVYGNLGLTDTAFSPLYAEGQFALLNYGYLFVNAALMAPVAAATVVSLRLATGGDPAMHAVLRRWAVIGGLASAALVAAVGGLLMWGPIARVIDARVGWSLSAAAGTFVLYAAPFGGLRMMNSIGRQFVVANEPRRVVRWDLVGLVGRVLVLAACAMTLGIAASPLALVFSEGVQIAAWWRGPRARPGPPD